MELIELDIAREIHPVDLIEQVAHTNDWAFERTGDDEISISVAGSWTDYHVSFSWMEDFEALHLACAFDIKLSHVESLFEPDPDPSIRQPVRIEEKVYLLSPKNNFSSEPQLSVLPIP